MRSSRTGRMLIARIKELVEDAVDDWGIEVTRAEILDVNLDQATRDAMLQQLNAERARRAAVTEAEGQKPRGRAAGGCGAVCRQTGR